MTLKAPASLFPENYYDFGWHSRFGAAIRPFVSITLSDLHENLYGP
jgi:hypothetical protein